MSSLRNAYSKLTSEGKEGYATFQTRRGNRFNSEKVLANFDTAVPFYALFENPIDSGVIVELQERKLKTFNDGLSSFQILWDYDISTAIKTPMPIFNQNNDFRVLKPGKAEISILNAVTVPDPDKGDWTIAGAATILDEGIQREPDFIPGGGPGTGNSAGDISPDLGVRIYEPGTGFLTKAVSIGNDNFILWGYDWFEIPIPV